MLGWNYGALKRSVKVPETSRFNIILTSQKSRVEQDLPLVLF